MPFILHRWISLLSQSFSSASCCNTAHPKEHEWCCSYSNFCDSTSIFSWNPISCSFPLACLLKRNAYIHGLYFLASSPPCNPLQSSSDLSEMGLHLAKDSGQFPVLTLLEQQCVTLSSSSSSGHSFFSRPLRHYILLVFCLQYGHFSSISFLLTLLSYQISKCGHSPDPVLSPLVTSSLFITSPCPVSLNPIYIPMTLNFDLQLNSIASSTSE